MNKTCKLKDFSHKRRGGIKQPAQDTDGGHPSLLPLSLGSAVLLTPGHHDILHLAVQHHQPDENVYKR